jgi:hypothetical protein
MRITILSTAIAILLLCGSPAQPQDSATRQKIVELVEITQVGPLMDQLIQPIMDQVFDLLRESNPNLPDSVLTIMQEELTSVMRESTPAFMEQFIPLYERLFEEAEIDAMLVFYKSAEGRSILKKLPELMNAGLLLGQQWGNAMAQELVPRLIRRLRREGYDI